MRSDGPEIITSIHNPGIRQARSLLRRKGRSGERAFLVEGVRAVTDMLAAGIVPALIYIRDTPVDRALSHDLEVPCPVRLVKAEVFPRLSDVPHPQGIVAVVPMSAVTTEPRFDVWRDDFILVADGVRDPGNLGTLLRSAAGAGVTEVLVTPNSVDPYNPKCVRAAMGAHFLVSLRQMTWEPLVERLSTISVIVIADAGGEDVADGVAWREPCAIIVGSEAFGPNDRLRDLATAYVRIPLARNLESLNAGVAGSHMVLEAARQRRRAASVNEPFERHRAR
ncbi:MAG: RNA methyltransferase [Chloroflexia bacterium]|nr:RNA methyltransferase [Chloroflexia bacterium]